MILVQYHIRPKKLWGRDGIVKTIKPFQRKSLDISNWNKTAISVGQNSEILEISYASTQLAIDCVFEISVEGIYFKIYGVGQKVHSGFL